MPKNHRVCLKYSYHCANCHIPGIHPWWRFKKNKNHFCSNYCRYQFQKRNRIYFKCEYCSNISEQSPSVFNRENKKHFCSKRCSRIFNNIGKFGVEHPAYKGIPRIDKDGYFRIHCPIRRRWVGIHRLKMEKKIGRLLKSDEVVHHKNKIRTDNRLTNLQIMSRQEHIQHHKKEKIRRSFGST